MKKETWISIGICAVILFFAGWFYVRSGDSANSGQEQWASVWETPSVAPQGTADVQTAAAETGSTACTVYICGAVRKPGVYSFPADARVCDAVEAAGGFRKKAARSAVNQARFLTDGEQITIPVRAGRKKKAVSSGADFAAAGASDLVNINQAELSELMTLSGIGEAKAKLIIEYREENGSFAAAEDIMKISGIKEGIYRQIKDQITV